MNPTRHGRSTTALGLLAPLAMAWAGCAPAPTTAADAAGSATTGSVGRGDFESELLLTGELRAVRSIEIKAPETSLFQLRIQFMAEEGSAVEPGDPLLDFDNSGLAEQVQDLESKIIDAAMQIVSKRNELASALKDLEIELAEKEYEQQRTQLEASVDPEVLSRKEHGERQFAFDAATRKLAQTREKVELTRRRGETELDVLRIDRDKLEKDLLVARHGLELLSIKAPAAGLVVYEQRRETTLRYQEGDSCWPGQAVMRLPDLSQMQVEFSVSEVDAPLLAVGMSLAIRLDSFPERELTGEIVHIPSMAVKRDENSKVAVVRVLASLSETWRGVMKPGMSALGRVVVERRHDVPLAPRAAVQFDGEHYRLLRQGADGRPTLAERIEPLARNDRYYVLTEEDYARLAAGGAGPLSAAALVGQDDDHGSTARVIRENFEIVVEAPGKLEAAVAYEIGPPSLPDVWSYELSWLIPEGQVVKRGDVIARFDSTELDDRLREHRATLEKVIQEKEKEKRNLEVKLRELRLDLVKAEGELKTLELDLAVPAELLSSIEVEQLRLRRALARQRVDYLGEKVEFEQEWVQARLELLDGKRAYEEDKVAYHEAAVEKFAVKAPVDGLVVYIAKRDGGRWEVGESVWMLAKIVEVADVSTLQVKASILEVDASRVEPGQSAEITVDAVPGLQLASSIGGIGRIVHERSLQDRSKVFDAILGLPGPHVELIRPGMGVHVKVRTDLLPGRLTLPFDAVRVTENNASVEVIGDDGPERRPVTLGQRNAGRVVIESGVEEGELVRLVEERG